MCGLGFTAFLAMWLGFLCVMIAAITMALVWAVRSRQFSDQDRARYLPLRSGIPEREPKRQKGK
ncbi:hypothetical protein [Geotalea sp. SG265]|uniref:hypothetical protein n=1 Tax=Geotalea sp. SG265 TaxID=2922867 RepID=UPI001FAFFD09